MDLYASPFESAVNRQGATGPGSRSLALLGISRSECDEKSYHPLFTLRREHHFAEVFAAFEIALRGASFRQREGLIDNHSKFPIVDEF
jgi:hypothetical protein